MGKTIKASSEWAELIKRIYEVDPLLCSCGRQMKITGFITHPLDVQRLLMRIGWPCEIHRFDPPLLMYYAYQQLLKVNEYDYCQLVPTTEDGFPATGPDPPVNEYFDPPHEECYCDPPHWEEPCIIYD